MPATANTTLEERFWAKVNKTDNDHWTWTGFHNGRGLAMFHFAGCDKKSARIKKRFGTISTTAVTAQRIMYALTFGDVPVNKVVYHLCGFNGCMNPDHLSLGTKQDQADYRVKQCKQVLGEDNGRSTLTSVGVKEIVKLVNGGMSRVKVAKIYNVCDSTICNIMSGHIWSHASKIKNSRKWRKRNATDLQKTHAWYNVNNDPRWTT